MNLDSNTFLKYLLLIALTFFCLHLEAVKPKNTLSNFDKKVLAKKEIQKNKKKLSLQQKASLFLLKKLVARKTKQAAKKSKPRKNKKSSVASQIMGIVSLILIPVTISLSLYSVFLVGIAASAILGILAIVFAGRSKKRIKSSPEEYGGNGSATTGLVLGIITVAFWLFVLFAWLSFLGLLLPLFG